MMQLAISLVLAISCLRDLRHGGALSLTGSDTNLNNPTKVTRASVVSKDHQQAHAFYDDDDHLRGRSRENYEESVDLDAISDAEALLACRSYLQKRRRLGPWAKHEERKQQRRKAMANFADQDPTESRGFFWEDPSHLTYYLFDEFDNETAVMNAERIPDDSDDFLWESVQSRGLEGYRLPLPKDAIQFSGGEEFSVFDGVASVEHQKRSEAALRVWRNSTFLAHWYKSRWQGRKISGSTRQRRSLQKRLRKIDPEEMLNDKSLQNMTEAEIESAIVEYVQARRKRRTSRRRQTTLVSEAKSKLELYVEGDTKLLEKEQRKRSQIAQASYATRIQNQVDQLPVEFATTKHANFPQSGTPRRSASTPQRALEEIEKAMDAGEYPTVEDVRMTLTITRLKGRREVYRRILRDCFGLRGRCIPSNLRNPKSPRLFVTRAPIHDVGLFIAKMLHEIGTDH